jgi:hypothetical protein
VSCDLWGRSSVVSCSNINGYLRNYQDCLTLVQGSRVRTGRIFSLVCVIFHSTTVTLGWCVKSSIFENWIKYVTSKRLVKVVLTSSDVTTLLTGGQSSLILLYSTGCLVKLVPIHYFQWLLGIYNFIVGHFRGGSLHFIRRKLEILPIFSAITALYIGTEASMELCWWRWIGITHRTPIKCDFF